jgi:hypothetical protein
MIAPRRYLTSRSSAAPFAPRECGEISSAGVGRRVLVTKLWCLLAAGTASCGASSGSEYQTRADLDPAAVSSTPDAGHASSQPSEHGGDGGVQSGAATGRDASVTRSLETDSTSDDGAPGNTTRPSEASNSAAPSATVAPPTEASASTQPDRTSTGLGETSMPDESSGPTPVPINGPPGQTNCTEVREESEDGCNYVLACDALSAASTCRANDDGTWACHCSGRDRESELAMPPMAVSQVCSSSAAFCYQNLAGEQSTLECGDTTNSVASDNCRATSDCVRTTTFVDGTVVTTAVSLNVGCFPDADANLGCSCRDDFGSRSFAVEGAGLDSGCTITSELCREVPSETVTCGARNLAEGVSCDAECGHEIETGLPDVRARLLDANAHAHCEVPTPGDDWYCSCANDAPLMSSYPIVSSSETAAVACLGAVNTCLAQEPFEPVGQPECSEAWFSEDPASCSANSDCIQPGVSGQYSVALRGFGIGAHCELTEAGLWKCYCASNLTSDDFGVNAETSGEACTTAYETCVTSAHHVPMRDGSPTFVFTLPSGDSGVE